MMGVSVEEISSMKHKQKRAAIGRKSTVAALSPIIEFIV
jgi:hypothetical protein